MINNTAKELIVNTGKYNAEKGFWVERLAGLSEVTSFSSDYNSYADEKNHYSKNIIGVNGILCKRIIDISNSNINNIHSILTACLILLIKKYSSSASVAVGSPVFIEGKDCIDELINKYFVIVTNVEDNMTFKELLVRTRNSIKDSISNQSYPFELLEKDLDNWNIVKESLSSIVVLFENIHSYQLVEALNAKMYFMFSKEADSIFLSVMYSNSNYDNSTIERITKHYMEVLNNVLFNTEIKVSEVEYMTEEEKLQLLAEFNDTAAEYPRDKTIQELFEQQAEKTPYNIAAVFKGQHVTYKQLNERANQLARTLRLKGIKADSIVGIMAERSIEMIVGIMGILKAGGAYLPISPEYPVDRIKYVIDDSGASLLLTQNHLLGKAYGGIEILNLEDDSIYDLNSSNLEPVSSSKSLAYVIYTSGSTGKPKGAMIEHHSVVNRIKWMQKKYTISSEDVILQKTPYTFDVSVWELFWWAMEGAKVVFLIPGGEKDPSEILKAIEEHKITTMHFVPSMLNTFLEHLEGKDELYNLKSLRQVFASGEALTLQQVERFNKLLNSKLGTKLINLYGPTEATVDVSYFDCSTGEKLDTVPIGKPIDNIKLFIVNKYNQLLPIGVAGELCISGVGLGRGYLNRPELTAEKFVANPYEQGAKMYRTGDLAKWRPDGNIEYLGRIDYQVKIRGFRIELGEIENKLLEHKAIKEAAVIARDDSSGNKYLCAYITAERILVTGELRKYLFKDLPDYMIPSYFIQMDNLPLTPNGKLDRKILPEPNRSICTGVEYEPPRNELEEKLVEMWKEVLGADKVGINDSFFDLGGHSLKATSLSVKIHKQLNVEVPLKEIFKAPTIKGISEYIKETEASIYAAIEKAEEKEYYQASSAQRRIYALQQLEPDSTSYNMPGAVEIEGKLDKAKLEEAFNKLIQRHESLRTSFELREEQIIQIIHKEVEFEVECIRLQGNIEKEDAEKEIKRLVREFNLSKAPLLRVGLIEIHPEKHILVYDMHHIISDGISISILIKDFTEAYAGKELPQLRIQYRDYAEWQNNLFNGERIVEKEKYWLKKFEGEIPVLSLPTDYQRPAMQSFEGDNISFKLGEQLTEKLRQIAKESESTLYMVMLAAFNVLLSKYSGQEDIVIGSPIAGRPHADLQNVLGMFVNTLAMRNYPSGKKSFREFLKEVKGNALRAYENQDYQFEELVDKLNITRDLSRNPLFDVMFAMQNMDMGEARLEGLTIKPYSSDNKISKFDITLTASEAGKEILLNIEYCIKLFNKDTIGRMGRHYENIIKKVTENPDSELRLIDIITEEERHQILLEFNDTEAEYPKNKTIHQLFEEQEKKTSNSVAVMYEDKHLTYRELNEKANQLARILRDKGAGPESIVGIMAERSLEMIVGILGILKAGGAYLPIDPEYPQERIEYMLEDSGAQLLLTQSWLIDNIKTSKESIILDDENLYKGDKENLSHSDNPNDLAYVIYTSGTTGKPKGAMIEHNSAINTLRDIYNNYPIAENESYLLKTAYTFDVSVSELFGWIFGAAKLVILKAKAEKDPYEIVNSIEKYRITHINFVPSMFNMFLEILDISKWNKMSSLKYIMIAGEAITKELVREIGKISTDAIFVNLYGPTEAAIYATGYKLNCDDRYIKVPIGKPIANTKVYIVDKSSNLQPIGVAGELCIAGDGLARGYLNSPKLTAEKFVDNPFRQGTRMYRTGDLARWLPDGNIEFLGRIDHQVKIRGYRIELGEIENKLVEHGDIKETVVVAKDDNSGGKYLCAYVAAEKMLTVTELREYLAKDLPDYMIPSYFMQMDKLPLTSNGKIDRKALPEPDNSVSTGTEYEAPRNEIEEKLVEIWKEVLYVEKIGINDSFFELGGHSLKATSLSAKIHKQLNVEVPLKVIFNKPTIKGISEYIKETEASIYAAIEKAEEKDYYKASSAQRRIYTLQQFNPDSTSYNMPGAVEIDGKLDKAKLEEAFNKLIQRHESLRTSFELRKEEIVQIIHKEVEFEVEYSELQPNASKESIEEAINKTVRTFDLGRAPLLRVGLLKIQAEKYILIYDMHHIISDGVSMGILTKEFAEVYGGKELKELRLQYKDYAEWQNRQRETERMKRQEEYWIDTFRGEIPALNLPTAYARPALQSFEGDSISFEIEEKLTEKLRNIAKQTEGTMYMVLLAVINILLSKYSGQEDIVIGSPIAGRPHADLESIMGIFINTLAMRNYPSGEKTVREFIKEVKVNALKAYENQDYQFEELVEKINLARDMSRNPLFDVMFILQNMINEELSIDSLKIKGYAAENKTAKLDLTITAAETAKGISINIEYCRKLFEKSSIERMKGHFIQVVEEVSECVDKQLNEIEITTGEEKEQLIVAFNDTAVEYLREKTIQKLFEEQVEKTPDNTAVVFGDKKLTYRELNKKANQLARILRDKGIGADSIVGLMAERSQELIIGIIGILKAGGAYLPIDPEYPQDRIEYMIEDSGAQAAVTQSWLAEKLPKGKQILLLDEAESYADDVSNLITINKSGNLAYVIYTSGSTGKPKGVMIEHSSVNNFIVGMSQNIEFKAPKSILALTTISFDIFGLETLLPLTKGMRIIICDERSQKNPDEIAELIDRNQIDILQATPSRMELILNDDKASSALTRLSEIIIGGELFTERLLKNLLGKTNAKIYNAYGPTETTIWSTLKLISGDSRITIGKPITNTEIYILDKNKHICPIGVSGELYIAGDGLARGYINRPELTNEKFIDNPFKEGTRMYRTGDLARWLPDGNIEYLGRTDYQVKIRGFRIELGEIEKKLIDHVSIKDAVVVAKADNTGGHYLCAYIVADNKQTDDLTISELREYLLNELPEYMIPSYFVKLEKLPLTLNGKLDRNALLEPDGSISTGVVYEAPRNAMEEKLVNIWQEVLYTKEGIGIRHNFFEIGGHSLKATEVIAKIHKEFNIEVTLLEFFKRPLIKELSLYLNSQNKKEYKHIASAEKKEYYPLSAIQKRMYIANQLEPQSLNYNMPCVVTFEGELDIVRLNEALAKLVKRHEAFRTKFSILEGTPVQIIEEDAELQIEYLEETSELKDQLKRFIRPFELDKLPLMRVGVVKSEQMRHIFMLDIHHIISDGTSTQIILLELLKLYKGLELPLLNIQYKDYAVWQNKFQSSAEYKKQEQYWIERFKNINTMADLPVDYPRGGYRSFNGSRLDFEISKEMTVHLKDAANSSGITLFMILLSAYNILLYQFTGNNEIIVGTPIAGRQAVDIQNVVGAFINTLAIRGYVDNDMTLADVLKGISKSALEAYSNQDYQFDDLVESLDIQIARNRNPIFDTLFILQNTGDEQLYEELNRGMGNLKILPTEYKLDDIRVDAKFDIKIMAYEIDGVIKFQLEYCSDLFKKQTMELFYNSYMTILKQITGDLSSKIEDIENLFTSIHSNTLSNFNDDLDYEF